MRNNNTIIKSFVKQKIRHGLCILNLSLLRNILKALDGLTSTSRSLYLQVYPPVSQNWAFSSFRLETNGFCPISVTVTCSLVLLKNYVQFGCQVSNSVSDKMLARKLKKGKGIFLQHYMYKI